MYDIEEPVLGVPDGHPEDQDEVTVTEVPEKETWEEMTERKDKDNKWLSE